MRAFLAIELPPEVRRALSALQQQLAESRADVKWTESDHLHVTMRFLGEISEAQRASIESLLNGIAPRHQARMIQLSQLGAFPSLSAPRVIWVGVGEGREWLAQLADHLEEGLVPLGFTPLLPGSPSLQAGEEWAVMNGSSLEKPRPLGRGVTGFTTEERPFAAHVTLGRVRSPRGRAQLINAMRQVAWRPPESFRVTHLTFFQSTLTGSGPIYTALARLPFIADLR